jgi:hypothetical protein
LHRLSPFRSRIDITESVCYIMETFQEKKT